MRPLLLVLVLLGAGCVAPAAQIPDAEPLPGVWPMPFPDPMGHDHDHGDASLHAHAWNFELLDHHPLAGTATHSSGVHALDIKNGFLFAAVYGGEADAEGGFFIFDIADPAHPKQVGRFRHAGPMGGDRSMEATSDAAFVVMGTEVLTCLGQVNPFAPGLYLVDVRDKANPRVVQHIPDMGVHTITVANIGGQDYAFTMKAGENVYRIVREPVPHLQPVAEVPFGHDAVVVEDPLMGKTLLFAANGFAGFEVWDVSDPENPQNIAGWNIPDRGDKYYVHTGPVRFIETDQGLRRIAVVSSEDWGDYPSPMWVVDMTDLGDIQVLATWENPGGHAADGLRYSLHNPRFHGDVIVAAHYHGGVWALDLADPSKPRVVGQFMPSESNGWTPAHGPVGEQTHDTCGAFRILDVPYTFDVISGDGVIYVADMHTGLYTIKPTW